MTRKHLSKELEEEKHKFSFSSSGYSLLDSEGTLYYEKRIPILEKLLSHLLWTLFWLGLIVLCSWISSSKIFLNAIFMACVFVHLFLFGCRLTELLIIGQLKPLFFPPFLVRVTRKLQRGGGIEILKRYDLDKHAGLLAHLAFCQIRRRERERAYETLDYGLKCCPGDSMLTSLRELALDG